MARDLKIKISRRRFMQTTAAVSAGALASPYAVRGGLALASPMKRGMGRLQFEATTLGLGGQASVQWTPADVDPVKIVLKAFRLGVNYFDTSNAYGPSQSNYGRAFRELHLIPGEPGYNERLRRSIFLTSKTGLRFAKGGWKKEGLRSFSNGPQGSGAVDDVKRTLTQVFGDGNGRIPAGAYLDMVLIHHLSHMAEIEALVEGLDKPDPTAEHIGALAALVDLRDGTNATGLNPKEERLIRHIGFSGHHSPPVMMEMIQRDDRRILEGMLVAINANDRLNFNMQHNVIPVAAARNMGIIAMKVFADGAMYTKDATWSNRPEHVVRTVGSPVLPSRPLVEYALTTPGIATAIIGIGQIAEDPAACQLQQNLAATQIAPNGLSASDRRSVEQRAAAVKDGKTNYFQLPRQELTAPRDPAATPVIRDGKRTIRLSWQTAYAGDEPIVRYEVRRDRVKIGQAEHRPQIDKKPFVFEDRVKDTSAHAYTIVSVDAAGRTAATEEIPVPPAG